MLIYHTGYTEDGDSRPMADVIDQSRAAFLCTYKDKNGRGETYTSRYAFVFDDDRKLADMSDYLEEFREYSSGRLVSIRAIRPNEVLTADIMLDYRPNYLPALRETI